MTETSRSGPRVKEGPRHEPVRILAVGDLVPASDFGTLIEIFAGVVRRNPRARLIIVGEGQERAALEGQLATQKLGEFVGLPGLVAPARLAEFVQRAHVYAVTAPTPSGRGLPPGLPAAMAGGICIVAMRSEAIERLVEDRVNGLLVEAGNMAALSRALHLCVSNANLRSALGEAAAATIRGRGRVA